MGEHQPAGGDDDEQATGACQASEAAPLSRSALLARLPAGPGRCPVA